MSLYGTRATAVCAFLAALCVFCRPVSAQTEPPRLRLQGLSRLVHSFDFEERSPFPMPTGFYRYHAPPEGFTLFGDTQFTSDVAYRGERSFEFTLQSGSVSARVSSGVIPVMPMADYTITAWVRTQGITHARARVAAWFTDVHGRDIRSSRVESELLETRGEWTMVSVDLNGGLPSCS